MSKGKCSWNEWKYRNSQQRKINLKKIFERNTVFKMAKLAEWTQKQYGNNARKNQELRYWLIDISNLEKQSEKKNEIDEKSLRDLWDNFQRSNICNWSTRRRGTRYWEREFFF